MASRILYIGASNEHHALARRLLQDEGHDFMARSTPAQAAEVAARSRPDLILADLEVGGADSTQLAARIRAMPGLENTPLVILGPGDQRDRLLAIGCNGIIEPPLNPSTFARQIGHYLKGHRERVRPAVRSRELEAFSRELGDRLEAKVVELTAANARLRRADEVKQRVLENISRELAAPLTPLVANLARLLSGHLGPVQPRQRRVLGAVDRDLSRLATTVSRVLDLAALADLHPVQDPRAIDLNETARQAARTLEAKARSRRVSLRLYLAPDAPHARVDSRLLQQALESIVDHAVAFAPRGGFVGIAVEAGASGASLGVYDSGDSLGPDARAELFDPFAGAGRRDGDGHPALSLGLSLAHRIAAALQITLEVESPPRHLPDDEHEYSGVCAALLLPPRMIGNFRERPVPRLTGEGQAS